jgi:uncharacterized protein DUF3310
VENESINSKQVGGSHYQTPIAHWDYILANNIGYMEAQIIKYCSRWKKKNGLEDLQKARHFLDKLIEWEQAKTKEQDDLIGTTVRVDDWRFRGEVRVVAKLPGIIESLYTTRVVSVDEKCKEYLVGSFIEVNLSNLQNTKPPEMGNES